MRTHEALAIAICLVLFIFQGCVDYSPLDLDGGNECTPSCKGKCCGPDGCGGTCPDNCTRSEICDRATCRCESAPTCETNEDCPRNYWCDRTVWECRLIDCIPNCTGRCCGSDGCDGNCPNNCPAGYYCNEISCQCRPSGCTTNADCQTTECCVAAVCTGMACGPLECGPDPVCGKECGPCGAGQTCQGGQCVTQGFGALGDPCTFGDVNITAGDCSAGLECLGIMADGTAGTCPGGASSECTNLLEEWNRDCVTGNCGASFCSARCDAQGRCPHGFVGQDVGDPPVCMCIPSTNGDGPPGDPCPWNNVNASYDDCEAGMACLGNDDIGSCPGGTDAECIGVPDTWNPDCVNGVCGFSFCAEECDAQGNCPAGFIPQDVGGACFCIPA